MEIHYDILLIDKIICYNFYQTITMNSDLLFLNKEYDWEA